MAKRSYMLSFFSARTTCDIKLIVHRSPSSPRTGFHAEAGIICVISTVCGPYILKRNALYESMPMYVCMQVSK